MSNQETTLSQSAKDFGYEEQHQPKIQLPDQTDNNFSSAIIAAASALGSDNPVVSRTLSRHNLHIDEVTNDGVDYLQLARNSDNLPLYHIDAYAPLLSVEEAARNFDRLGNKELYNELMGEASKATAWEHTTL